MIKLGVAIVLRTKSQPNNFRNTLLSVISDSKINKVFMTYPYFYENKPYKCTMIDDITGEEYEQIKSAKYSVLDDGFLGHSLANCILNRTDFTVVTISSKSSEMWKKSYENFAHKLYNKIQGSRKNIKYEAYYTEKEKEKLHAKIFIGCVNNEPAFLVIGSSNLTNNAFGTFENFNYEADVILWDDQKYKFDYSILQSDELVPIIATANTPGVEGQYINHFYKQYASHFRDHIERIILDEIYDE